MTQLVRHGAPVYGEIVGELLSVKGNIKRRTSGSARLARQIGEKLFTGGPLGHVLEQSVIIFETFK